MKIYLVGGALRDRLLDLPVKDHDWLVVGGTADEMLALGYRQVDAGFPVFLQSETGEEYALARREIKSGPGYKGFDVESTPDVTLEQDLLRRDLTINAMVEDDQGNIIDPFNGRDDLDNGLLRHVSPAFVEDPVRLLRIARFAAKLGCWGFRVAHSTHKLMKQMAASDDILALKPERVWQEMVRALAEPQPWRFFEVLHSCGALERLLPELAMALGDPGGHGQFKEGDAIGALKRAATHNENTVRFAALFYFAACEPGLKGPLLKRLPLERDYLDLLELTLSLGEIYPTLTRDDAEGHWELLKKGRALQQPERFWGGIGVCGTIWPDQDEARQKSLALALGAANKISAALLQSQGVEGAALGKALSDRRRQAIADSLSEQD